MKIVKDAALVIGVVALAATGIGLAVGASLAAGIGTLSAVAAADLGVSAGLASSVLIGSAVVTGLGVVESVLPKPSQGGSQTKWKADPYAGLPYVMGRTLVSGNIVLKRGSGGSNNYEYFVTVLSGAGPIHNLEASFANRTTVTFAGALPADGQNGSAVGTYHDYILQVWQRGNCPEASAMMPYSSGAIPGWTGAHKLSGMAATLVSMRYHSTGKNPFTTEVQMAWILQGVLAYDPRLDDTYPGGAGACRAFDETTYVYSENPHIHGLTYAMGRYQNGKRVAGIGATMAQIDVPAFVEGANLDDARGWKIGGQVASRPDTPWNTMKSIMQAGGATPVIVGGVISCINRAPRVSLATITHGEIVGDCSFSNTQPRRTRINGVIPMYRSEAHDWEYVSADGVFVAAYVALDGGERTKEIQYSLVQQVDQAAQLATYDICDAREAGPGTIPLKPWWLNYRIGDCVTFNPEDDFSIKIMITGREIDAQSGVVSYTVKSETDSKHAFALGQTGSPPPTASLIYDPSVPDPDPTAWAITGVTLTSATGAVPAIEIDGGVDNDAASAVLFDIRLHVAGQADDVGWEALSADDPTVRRKVITSVTAGTAYEVGVTYVVRGLRSDRLILGPATAGVAAAAGDVSAAIATSYTIGLSGNITYAVETGGATASVTIPDHTRIYPQLNRSVAVTGATLTGLALSTFYLLVYDDPTLGFAGAIAPTYLALTDAADSYISPDHPSRHNVGNVTTPASDGSGAGSGGSGPPGSGGWSGPGHPAIP